MSLRGHEFDQVVSKFGFETRDAGDRLAWLKYNGQIVVRTKRSHGGGELPFHHHIRQQLKLNEDQMREAVNCTLDRDGYLAILRAKGILPG